MDSLPEAIVVLDANGLAIDMNRTALSFAGVDSVAALSRHGTETRIATEDQQAFREHVQAALAGEDRTAAGPLRYVMHGYDGTRRVLEGHIAPLHGPDGTIGGALLISRDITAQEEAQIEIDKGQALLGAIIDTLPVGVGVFDTERRLVRVNPAGLAMIGADSVDMVRTLGLAQLMTADSLAIFEQHFVEALADNSPASAIPFRQNLPGLDGTMRLVDCRISRLNDAHGAAAGVVVTARDVTREVTIQAENDESHALLQAILESLPIAMFVIDEAGLIVSFSRAAVAMFGYLEADVLGLPGTILVPPATRADHGSKFREFIESELQSPQIGISVTEGMRRDGSTFPMNLTMGEAVSGGNRFFTVFVRDLTRQIEQEEQLQRLQSELFHASRLNAVGTLASALAHELNQPLTAIANYAAAARDLAGRDPLDARDVLQTMLEKTVSESQRAGQIVRRLRSFVAKGEVDMRVLSLGRLIQDAATIGMVGAREAGVTWSLDIETGSGPILDKVLADRIQIQQVLVNLMRNAIESMHDSPVRELTIAARPGGHGLIEIAVRDTGPGIAAEIRDDLFRPFSSTKGQGMGLGLSICRAIVEAHGGKLWLDGDGTFGTVFKFTLMSANQDEIHE